MGPRAPGASRPTRTPPHPTSDMTRAPVDHQGSMPCSVPRSRARPRPTVAPGRLDDLEAAVDPDEICSELDRVRADFRELLDTATVAELREPSDGTKWTN